MLTDGHVSDQSALTSRIICLKSFLIDFIHTLLFRRQLRLKYARCMRMLPTDGRFMPAHERES